MFLAEKCSNIYFYIGTHIRNFQNSINVPKKAAHKNWEIYECTHMLYYFVAGIDSSILSPILALNSQTDNLKNFTLFTI